MCTAPSNSVCLCSRSGLSKIWFTLVPSRTQPSFANSLLGSRAYRAMSVRSIRSSAGDRFIRSFKAERFIRSFKTELLLTYAFTLDVCSIFLGVLSRGCRVFAFFMSKWFMPDVSQMLGHNGEDRRAHSKECRQVAWETHWMGRPGYFATQTESLTYTMGWICFFYCCPGEQCISVSLPGLLTDGSTGRPYP